MSHLISSRTQAQSLTKIYRALYPRWQYTGGWITAEMLDDHQSVLLRGFIDPTLAEQDVITREITAVLGGQATIYWRRIGADSAHVRLLAHEHLPIPTVAIDTNAVKAADRDVSALVEVLKTYQASLTNKATQDVNTLAQLYQGATALVHDPATHLAPHTTKIADDLKVRADQLFAQLNLRSEQIVLPVKDAMTALWAQDWIELLYGAMEKFIHSGLSAEVAQLKQDFSSDSCRIVNTLICRKVCSSFLQSEVGQCLNAMGTLDLSPPDGLTKLMEMLGNSVLLKGLPFQNTAPALIALCYQIALVYDFDELDRAHQAELLAIVAISLSLDLSKDVSLNLLNVKNVGIAPITNVLLFLIVGHIARLYFEAKRTGVNPLMVLSEYERIKQQGEAYFKALLNGLSSQIAGSETTLQPSVV